MAKIGFNKNLQKSCAYCIYGKTLSYTGETVCKKRGVMSEHDYCRSYKYDPLKQIPQTPKIADNYSEEDFKL